MTPATVRCVIAASAVIALSGCGPGDAPEADETSQTSSASRAPVPSQAFGPNHAEGVIEKKIGEPAGLNCSENPEEPCDLNFNVTAIQQDARCTAAAEPPGPGQQFLRFDIEAFSSYPTFDFQGSEDALLLQNWSVDGADGASFQDLTYYSECSKGAVPISNRLAAGEHPHATVVVRAPKPATALRFSWFALTWEWPVPGAD
jgi:hypothetical protein